MGGFQGSFCVKELFGRTVVECIEELEMYLVVQRRSTSPTLQTHTQLRQFIKEHLSQESKRVVLFIS